MTLYNYCKQATDTLLDVYMTYMYLHSIQHACKEIANFSSTRGRCKGEDHGCGRKLGGVGAPEWKIDCKHDLLLAFPSRSVVSDVSTPQCK